MFNYAGYSCLMQLLAASCMKTWICSILLFFSGHACLDPVSFFPGACELQRQQQPWGQAYYCTCERFAIMRRKKHIHVFWSFFLKLHPTKPTKPKELPRHHVARTREMWSPRRIICDAISVMVMPIHLLLPWWNIELYELRWRGLLWWREEDVTVMSLSGASIRSQSAVIVLL